VENRTTECANPYVGETALSCHWPEPTSGLAFFLLRCAMAAGPEVLSEVPLPTGRATPGTNSRPKGLADGALVFIGSGVIGLVCIYSSVIGIGRSLIARRIIAPKQR
jgi:hypothetical protein